MKLKKHKFGDNVEWDLITDEQVNCRHCGKEDIKYGYLCRNDKKVSCVDCMPKDNKYIHIKKYLENPNSDEEIHEHYKVFIKKGGVLKSLMSLLPGCF